MRLDCVEQRNLTSATICGAGMMLPCCHLQDVVDKMTEGDTISLIQRHPFELSACKPRKERVTLTKSIQIRIGSSHDMEKSRIQNLHLEINSVCTKTCSFALMQSHLYCSKISVQNMDILVENTTFTNSYVDFKSDIDGEVDIKQTEFRVTDEELPKAEYAEHAKYPIANVLHQKTEQTDKLRYYIELFGIWKAVKLSNVMMLGNGSNAISGIAANDGQIDSIGIVSVTMSQLVSVLTTDLSLHLIRVIVQDSIFTGNEDGIYLDNIVMNLLLWRCVFERTAPWNPDQIQDNKCSSALRATVVRLQILDSSFRRNRAVGRYCTGSALSINLTKISWGYGQDIVPTVSTSMTADQLQHHLWNHPLAEITDSLFIENTVDECYMDYWESDFGFKILHNGTSSRGGAIAIQGLGNSFKVYNSTFIENKGCQGAGLHIYCRVPPP